MRSSNCFYILCSVFSLIAMYYIPNVQVQHIRLRVFTIAANGTTDERTINFVFFVLKKLISQLFCKTYNLNRSFQTGFNVLGLKLVVWINFAGRAAILAAEAVAGDRTASGISKLAPQLPPNPGLTPASPVRQKLDGGKAPVTAVPQPTPLRPGLPSDEPLSRALAPLTPVAAAAEGSPLSPLPPPPARGCFRKLSRKLKQPISLSIIQFDQAVRQSTSLY